VKRTGGRGKKVRFHTEKEEEKRRATERIRIMRAARAVLVASFVALRRRRQA
jgi:hypothetical protein